MDILHIANLFEAPRDSATAKTAIAMGAVVTVEPDADGSQKQLKLATQASDLVEGLWGIAWKVSADPDQVASSTTNADIGWDAAGDHVVKIAAGDQIVHVGVGARVDYPCSLLDASLDPARAGAQPAVGAKLAINPANSLWCGAAVVGAITDPVCGVVIERRGSDHVVIQLVG